MASRQIIDGGESYVPQIPVTPVSKENVNSLLGTLQNTIVTLTKRINGLLSLGTGTDGSRAGNLDAQEFDILTPSGADTEFIVIHGLDRVAVHVEVTLQDKAGSIYTSSLGSWSKNVVYLKCSASSMTVRLRIS